MALPLPALHLLCPEGGGGRKLEEEEDFGWGHFLALHPVLMEGEERKVPSGSNGLGRGDRRKIRRGFYPLRNRKEALI